MPIGVAAALRQVQFMNDDLESDDPAYHQKDAPNQQIKKKTGPKPGHNPRVTSNVLFRRRMFAMVRDGKSPADVMYRNMTFWDEKAQLYTKQFEELVVDPVTTEEGQEEVKAVFRSMVLARDKAQSCAKDLAPFIHPILKSVTYSPEAPEVAPDQVPTDALEASQVYQRLIAGPGKEEGE